MWLTAQNGFVHRVCHSRHCSM